jgi:tetratricopeptide (TPR) repeat protein
VNIRGPQAYAHISLGELAPPAPRACFGRSKLIKKLVGFAENLEHIALIDAGGTGKTSVALTVLHHHRIKARFGDNRRFIRCDEFPASHIHFLARLSKVIGAGIENPEDLMPLRASFSSQEMLIVLDNADSIFDPLGTYAQEIYGVVDELCQFENICLLITSRTGTVPPHCKSPGIPKLSIEAARDIFYDICNSRWSSDIDDLLPCLDFHPLSITLLAATVFHNRWDDDDLTEDWDVHRKDALQTGHNQDLVATIELSLDFPTFRKLGPDARDLLGVVAFFPQGVDEDNIDWVFSTIPDRVTIFTKFYPLYLTSRNNGFITMLAPIRDYFRPQNPESFPLLRAIKDRYFTRLSADVDPTKPTFEDAKWIRSEDSNVEHLLDVFTSTDPNAGDVWDACIHFMDHLYWHKPRRTVLGPKIEALPDNHPSKSRCLFGLSRLFESVGNPAEQKRLLSQALTLERENRNVERVASTLCGLSDANRGLGLYEEGIQRAEKALGTYERLGDRAGQAQCLVSIAHSFYSDGQLDVAVGTASRAISLLPEGKEFMVCRSHRVPGDMYRSKREREEAIYQYKAALRISSAFNWPDQLFLVHFALARLFYDEDKFGGARAHANHSRSHADDGSHHQGRAMEMQAKIWYRQSRLGEAKLEVSRAKAIYRKRGEARDVGYCKQLLREIGLAMKGLSVSDEPDPSRRFSRADATSRTLVNPFTLSGPKA